MKHEITTDILKLKIVEETDAEKLFWIRSNAQVNQFIKRTVSHNVSDVVELIKTINSDSTKLFFTINLLENNELIGSIALKRIDSKTGYAEIGYELLPEYQNRGIMSNALKSILNFCSKELELKAIEAYTNKANLNSRKLLEKFNFQLQESRTDKGNPDNVIYRLII